jgi:hypothetical protein
MRTLGSLGRSVLALIAQSQERRAIRARSSDTNATRTTRDRVPPLHVYLLLVCLVPFGGLASSASLQSGPDGSDLSIRACDERQLDPASARNLRFVPSGTD